MGGIMHYVTLASRRGGGSREKCFDVFISVTFLASTDAASTEAATSRLSAIACAQALVLDTTGGSGSRLLPT